MGNHSGQRGLVPHGTPFSQRGLPREGTGGREGEKWGLQEVERQGKGRREEGTLQRAGGLLDEADSDRMGGGEECTVSFQLPPWDQ